MPLPQRDLLPLARRVADEYVRSEKVVALLAVGSTAGGYADAFSDLDLVVFWRSAPSDDERLRPIGALGAEIDALHPFEEDEWAEEFELRGVRIGTSMFVADLMDHYLEEVVGLAKPDDNAEILIAAVQGGRSLHGHELIERWRATAADYPGRLVDAIFERHFGSQGGWGNAPMLAQRGDLVALYAVVDDVVRAMLRMLLALNRRYLSNPSFKWLDRSVSDLERAPKHLARRLRRVYTSRPADGVVELQSLLEETLALVEGERPLLDISDAQAWMSRRRSLTDALG